MIQSRKRRACMLLAALLAILSLPAVGAAPGKITTRNISTYVGNDQWNWTVFLEATPEVLTSIQCVQYTLHPTFPKPVRNVCEIGDRRYPFGLSSQGWGVFEIAIRVSFKNGDRLSLKHMLSFEAPQVERPLPISADNTARQIRTGYWTWTVFIKAPEEVLSQVQCVQYTLHPTFADPVREVCERGSTSQAFPLTATGWGTFLIPVRVTLKNGRSQELSHQLRFSTR